MQSKNQILRTGLPNQELQDMFGPLAGLIGTWSGNKGVNLVAVPDQQGGFTLLVAPYSETLTITALSSPTPNRGLQTIEKLPTLMYSLSIYNSVNNTLMHAENGVWELINPATNNGFNIARIATVPHGDAILMPGQSSITAGRPVINIQFSALPTGGLPPRLGYTDVYNPVIVPGFTNSTPNVMLSNFLDTQQQNGQVITSTTNLIVSTTNNGGISNIPSINNNAVAAQVDASFWIETVEDKASGTSFMQLQYSQNTIIEFPVTGTPAGQTIQWPHVNINTLMKQ